MVLNRIQHETKRSYDRTQRKVPLVTNLTVRLKLQELHVSVVHDLCTAGSSPTQAVARALLLHLLNRFDVALGDRLLKPPVMQPLRIGSEGAATLHALIQRGYDPWYLELRFATRPGDVVDHLDFQCEGIELVPIDYGFGVQRAFQIKHKPLKTQVNHVVRINHVRIAGQFFATIRDAVRDSGRIEQPLLASFQPDPGIRHLNFVSYDHMITGDRFFCSCAKPYHQDNLQRAKDCAHSYASGSWPEKVISLLQRAQYLDGLCHLCIAREQSDEEAVRRYGSNIENEYATFIPQVAFDLGVDKKTARAKVMELLGLSRWVREALLYRVLQELFPDQIILREASPQWLGRMRLDMYLPDLGLAVEHQGEQHYRPISAFGGEASHARVMERDKLKRELCRANGVSVVDVRFDAPISKAAIGKRLQRFLAIA